MPVDSDSKLYPPSDPDMNDRVRPVLGFRRVMEAPGTAAPEVSVKVPLILPRSWAKAAPMVNRSQKIRFALPRARALCRLGIYPFPLCAILTWQMDCGGVYR